MTDHRAPPPAARGPGLVEQAISALYAWIGDSLAADGNPLHQPMAVYRDNRPLALDEIPAPPSGKLCVLVHGLGCNESSWSFAPPEGGLSYGVLLEQRCGFMPLYLRYNTGLHISQNGGCLADILQAYSARHGEALKEILLIGHSMGGLVIRSACQQGSDKGHSWVAAVRHVVYLGSPHQGAPLERATNLATSLLGRVDTTATRVVRDVLNSRSSGVKDLRFGNLVDQDWQDGDPDEPLHDRRMPVPWLATAHHHLVVGHLIAGVGVLGDAMVLPNSAAGSARGALPGAPEGSDVQVIDGLHHLQLSHHRAVYEHIESWVTSGG